ncbi:ferritin-like domain-containing protein [Helicobacter sp. 11S02596-1]|uniref:ferritin-like domain-containing protein n=1 Tax=Helicobacter sp. 11S02596-1 TaxID=1476194 RepID=UPI000BA55891|nr:ferritin-like domain-containing protein [Helicobacter sp. 11S02596-1]PAF42096.1 hypothetical protein BJI48_07225 [Helicobacter sp. 11S02596-1]
MKEFFSSLEAILFEPFPARKIAGFKAFYDDFLHARFDFCHDANAKPQLSPSYSGFCQIVHPTKISRPKAPSSPQNIAKIIHSIAHIEYSAIDLALDATYRFRHLPLRYYQDWLEVASEEIKHFCLLQSILEELGFAYGDFFVHNNLFEAMVLTQSSLRERMGLVHRGLEAMGLDANPFVTQKIQNTPHPIKTKITEALEIILIDEISHVSKGDTWWRYTQPDKNAFINLLRKFNNFNLKGKIINTQARLQAGFTPSELEMLGTWNPDPTK